MPRPTLRPAAGLVLGFVSLLLPCAGGARAQEKKNHETVRFETIDAVELKGTYWPSTRGRKGPVAILLHRPNGSSSEDGWHLLGDDLQKAGFAVLAFDFRGHGDSTGVSPEFWDFPHNVQNVKRKGGTKPTSIAAADFMPRYWQHLINDITAAKRYLERRYNDSGECNTSNIVLIGAEGGATLGALWLETELKRYRLVNGVKNKTPEGKDVVACVWLNMSGYLGGSPVAQLKTWLKNAGNGREIKIPMAFLYGKDDKNRAESWAVELVKAIRPNYKPGVKAPKTDELRGTLEFGIPGTQLVGSKLLANPLPTRAEIVVNYLQGFIFDENKGQNEWEKRDNEANPSFWEVGLGQQIFCHPIVLRQPVMGKNLLPVPLLQLGIR
jgi:hypothetical protein